MKLPRRNFLHLAAGAAALPAMPRFAWASGGSGRDRAARTESLTQPRLTRRTRGCCAWVPYFIDAQPLARTSKLGLTMTRPAMTI